MERERLYLWDMKELLLFEFHHRYNIAPQTLTNSAVEPIMLPVVRPRQSLAPFYLDSNHARKGKERVIAPMIATHEATL